MQRWVWVLVGGLGCQTPPADQRVLPVVASASAPEPTGPAKSASPVAARSATAAATPSSVPSPEPAASASVVAEPEGAPPLRKSTHIQRARDTSGDERIKGAEANKLGVVKSLFANAGVSWPPKQVLLRAFKREDRVELWAASDRSGPLTHVTTYEICYASGELGPKRQEGDLQVPEGFYKLVWFKAKSSYHMAMQVSYPNTSDRVLGHPKHPGGEIMIHGDCVSVGCLAMSDERIEEIWIATRAAPRPIEIHIFPTRDMDGLLAKEKASPHHAFWLNLKEGFDRFNKTKERFVVRSQKDGTYRFADRN